MNTVYITIMIIYRLTLHTAYLYSINIMSLGFFFIIPTSNPGNAIRL